MIAVPAAQAEIAAVSDGFEDRRLAATVLTDKHGDAAREIKIDPL